MNYIQIAIDGPAGAGKSTIARQIAKALNITYIDTGAMYRALTYKALVNNIDINNGAKMIQLAKESDIKFVHDNIFLDGKIVNEEIRSGQVSKNVSYVAKIAGVRDILVNIQRQNALNHNVIMDGRDIGTNVLPNATLKIFLTASVDKRSHRRFNEYKEKGIEVELNEIKRDIILRDKTDTERKTSPLVKAQDAIEIDTTDLSIKEVVEKITKLLKKEW